ncbi:MAG: lipoprotein signal peptidase [Chitinophagales bacterium]
MKRSTLAIALIFLVLAIDQCLKIWIKTNFTYGEEIKILGADWARLHFIENDGMAFGMRLSGEYGKLSLTLFRIIAVTFIGYYLITLIKQKASKSLIVSIALIFSGAVGNIIDSMFYGMFFDRGINPANNVYLYAGIAQMNGEGYSTFLHGNVVDMFYFPIVNGQLPEFLGGRNFEFFRPVFNIADSAISIGVLSILLFNRGIFKDSKKNESNKTDSEEIVSEEDKPAENPS